MWVCISCGKEHKRSRWDTQKAQNEGWFFTKDGQAYCPDHIPDWVGPWRARRSE